MAALYKSLLPFLLIVSMGLTSCKKVKTLGNSQQQQSPSRNQSPKMLPEIDQASSFSQGPAILPRESLLAYFDQQEGNPVYKVPVVLIYKGDGFQQREVFIGVEETTSDADKVILDPDDSGLGIGLSDRVEEIFGDNSVCHAWLIGQWSALVEMDIPGLEGESDAHPFTVHEILARDDGPQRNADAHIWAK